MNLFSRGARSVKAGDVADSAMGLLPLEFPSTVCQGDKVKEL